MKNILFVCTGNSCRSVMAEGFLKAKLREKGIEGVTVQSGGVAAMDGFGPTRETDLVMKEKDVDVSAHQSQRITDLMIEEADHIFVMTQAHFDEILGRSRSVQSKLFYLNAYGTQSEHEIVEIPDPIGNSLGIYQSCRDIIEQSVDRIVEKILSFYKTEGNKMRIRIGADHGGFEIKKGLTLFLEREGHSVEDVGTFSNESCDYPEIGAKVAQGVSSGDYDRGVLICKSGIGQSIVANKFLGVRAALCHTPEQAILSREHNNANVLVLGANQATKSQLQETLKVWLETPFESGGRHERRVQQIKEIEKENFR